MDLTPERKAQIDAMDYSQLLRYWRFGKWGDPWFQGETGEYWATRMGELRKAQGEKMHVSASKFVGWADNDE